MTIKAFAQFEDIPVKELNFRERIFWGGNLGLQFGNLTFIDVSPLVGYRFTDKISAGPGISYMYYRENFRGFAPFSTTIYGGRVFGRYHFRPNMFGHAEYEVLNLEYYSIFTNGVERANIPSFLVGGGFRQPLGGRLFMNLLALFNLNPHPLSPYSNPVIRMGFGHGF
jgi:hypothetical protein